MKRNENDAIDLEQFIPVGHENAVSRKWLSSITGSSDRVVRRAIEVSELPIINMGYGYYIPDMENEVDRSEMQSYIAQERSRMRAIENRLDRKFGEFIATYDEPDIVDDYDGMEM